MSEQSDEKVTPADLRIDLILRVQQDHMSTRVSSKQSPKGEESACRCGVAFKGDGALTKGRRHSAEVVLAALDEAGLTR